MLYLVIIFLSAFLLFQVQPLIAKLILPLFGGGAAIWTACLLFFQAFLLLGYLYAHCLTQLKNLRTQVIAHSGLLLLSLSVLPIGLSELALSEAPNFDVNSPLIDILFLLVASVGLPYFLLSSTGPLVQRWLSYMDIGSLPYKLYSLSNIGSLLALLSYPFIFEPQFSLHNQLLYWSIGYGLFVFVISLLCLRLFKSSTRLLTNSDKQHLTDKEVKFDALLWIGLSSVGVILLVSITNAMTQNIPPIPFLWILPLCLYLLTFIICFHSPKWYVRWYWFALFAISSFAGILMFFIGSQFGIISQIVIYSLILLASCMVCHGELVKLRPSADRLTLFYLNMSLGGFLGSAFVAFIAQKIFSQFYELPLALFSVYVLFSLCLYLTKAKSETGKSKTLLNGMSIISLFSLIVFFNYLHTLFANNTVASSRNFYGILTIKDVEVNDKVERRLIDGTTSHGTQSQNEELEHIPMSYYRADTGVALALEHLFPMMNVKVGLIGLGAGTLAAYSRPGDEYTFYELNPDVEAMAWRYFSYLEDSKGDISIVLGDGRVSLNRELASGQLNNYQVLVLDAFSGDSVPAHLLTKEAFELYFKHLDEEGILAIHVSNSHLDLTSLTRGLAGSLNKSSLYVKTDANNAEVNQTQWVIITNNKAFLNNAKVKDLTSPWPNSIDKNIVWTDDYSNLLSVLK